MILALDVHYGETAGAVAAGVLFADWQAPDCIRTIVKWIDHVEPYEPGRFYKRELPCLLAVIREVDEPLAAIVVDGYVELGGQHRPGLGRYLSDALNESIPVIGVAKTRFVDTPEEAKVLRGASLSPLYVTAAGVPLAQAKDWVRQMQGEHRLPTLLKKVDQLCRGLD